MCCSGTRFVASDYCAVPGLALTWINLRPRRYKVDEVTKGLGEKWQTWGVRVVGITAAVATLVGYTTGLFYGFSLRVLYGFSLRVLFTGSLYGFSTRFIYSGYLLGTTVLIILSIRRRRQKVMKHFLEHQNR
jgi:hypothetical protein